MVFYFRQNKHLIIKHIEINAITLLHLTSNTISMVCVHICVLLWLINKYEQLPNVFEGWKKLTLITESLCEEISDAFDISIKIPTNKGWRSK